MKSPLLMAGAIAFASAATMGSATTIAPGPIGIDEYVKVDLIRFTTAAPVLINGVVPIEEFDFENVFDAVPAPTIDPSDVVGPGAPGDPAPVPLPGSAGLILSGFAAFALRQRLSR